MMNAATRRDTSKLQVVVDVVAAVEVAKEKKLRPPRRPTGFSLIGVSPCGATLFPKLWGSANLREHL